ncbi:MAG TPA: hypothetical protein VGU22_20000 [Methylomirabilota bacterium]|nr:hypothetical protein [Methylomirabilota bacterium]
MLALAACTASGCALLNVPPAREPLEQKWIESMLAGRYGRWEDGRESRLPKYETVLPLPGRIESYPWGATFTRYNIEIEEYAHPEGAGWWLQGGLLARAQAGSAAVELFGRETDRIHRRPFSWGFDYGKDVEYDFFLVVRPGVPTPARLIARWHFPAGALALSGDPIDRDLLKRSTRRAPDIEGFIHPARGEMRRHLVDGFLDFDPVSRIATVRISGLTQPFQATIDLVAELER